MKLRSAHENRETDTQTQRRVKHASVARISGPASQKTEQTLSAKRYVRWMYACDILHQCNIDAK